MTVTQSTRVDLRESAALLRPLQIAPLDSYWGLGKTTHNSSTVL